MKAKEVHLIYIGKRLDGEKLVQAFLQGEKEIYFSKVRHPWIGHCYKATESKDGMQIQVRPEEVDGKEVRDEELLDKWRLEQQVAQHKRDRILGAKKSGRVEAIERVVNILKPLTKKMSYSDRGTLVEAIMNELHKSDMEEINLMFNKRIKRIVKGSRK